MSSSIFPSTGAADHLSFTEFLDDILFDFSPDQSPLLFSSGSDNSTRKTNTSSSGSDDGNQWQIKAMDDRRKKRMISNRESARRSRMRKQKHLENLRNQVTRYTTGNQELMNRLHSVNRNGQIVQRENERLLLESVILQQKLDYLRQLLGSSELHDPLLAYACMAMH